MRVLTALVAAILLYSAAVAQQTLSNKDIVDMVNAGISPSVIITKIKYSGCGYDTTTAALAALTKQQIPDQVLSAMIACGHTGAPELEVQTTSTVETLLPDQSAATARRGDIPDVRFTPGAVLTTDAATVCVSGYSATVRNVSEATKNKIYAEYGITSRQPHEFEIDHDVSLEIGGSNDPSNLWPQSYITTPWNAYVKDKLENYLHDLVCKQHTLTLKQAQDQIRGDWRVAYVKYFGLPPGAAPLTTEPDIMPSTGSGTEPAGAPTPSMPRSTGRETEITTTPTSPRSTAPSRSSGGHTYLRGERGGCYYLSPSGKKVYVSHDLCGG